jgi:ankyrin repeat protein
LIRNNHADKALPIINDTNKDNKDENGFPIITVATIFGQTAIVEKLIDLGAEINAHDTYSSDTPLMYACYMGYPQIALVLIHSGADITIKGYDGKTPLDIANDFMVNPIRSTVTEGDKMLMREVIRLLTEKQKNINNNASRGRTSSTATADPVDGGRRKTRRRRSKRRISRRR